MFGEDAVELFALDGPLCEGPLYESLKELGVVYDASRRDGSKPSREASGPAVSYVFSQSSKVPFNFDGLTCGYQTFCDRFALLRVADQPKRDADAVSSEHLVLFDVCDLPNANEHVWGQSRAGEQLVCGVRVDSSAT